MRILIIGQADFGAATLRELSKRNEDVVAVYVPPETSTSKQDPLKEASLEAGVPVFQPIGYKDDQTYDEFTKLDPDLVILAFVTTIIPLRYIESATLGAICYHPSLLPRHRGASAINWALIMGDEKTGLTIFWPDSGIDTGPILYQQEVPISPDDTVGSLYFNHLFPMGVDAIVKSAQLIREGNAPKISQDEKHATYEPPCDDKVARIEWHKSASEIFNLVRGCDPSPGAYGFWKGEKIRFYNASILQEITDAPSGEIISINPYIEIALPDGRLRVNRIRITSGDKISASEYVKESEMKVGDTFLSSQ